MTFGKSAEEEIDFLGSKLKWVSEIIILGITHGKGKRDLVVENYESVFCNGEDKKQTNKHVEIKRLKPHWENTNSKNIWYIPSSRCNL